MTAVDNVLNLREAKNCNNNEKSIYTLKQGEVNWKINVIQSQSMRVSVVAPERVTNENTNTDVR